LMRRSAGIGENLPSCERDYDLAVSVVIDDFKLIDVSYTQSMVITHFGLKKLSATYHAVASRSGT
jgi:hypothetical protein